MFNIYIYTIYILLFMAISIPGCVNYRSSHKNPIRSRFVKLATIDYQSVHHFKASTSELQKQSHIWVLLPYHLFLKFHLSIYLSIYLYIYIQYCIYIYTRKNKHIKSAYQRAQQVFNLYLFFASRNVVRCLW